MATVRWLMLLSLSCLAAPAETALGCMQVGNVGGPWLRVYGLPKSAVVMVDGREMGVVPGKFKVDSGAHDVVVRLQGYHDAEYKVNVPSDKKHVTEVQIDLAVDASQKALVRQPKDKPEVVQVGGHSAAHGDDKFPLWPGLTLMGVGVAGGIGLGLAAATTGDTTEGSELVRSEIDGGPFAAYAIASGALFAAGVALTVLHFTSGKSETQMALLPNGMMVRGKF